MLGIVIPALFMTACAGSPASVDQPWVWRQGPGNVDEGKMQPSSELGDPETTTADSDVSEENNRYTQAVRYDNLLYVSGQIPIDFKSLKLVGETIEEQTQTVMNNLQSILKKNGMTMSNIVSVTLYLKEINDLGRVDGIYETYFRRTLPARTVVAVAALPRGSRLEISVVAGH
ncbi:MAG: Rid family detoxifying hydrolase [Marinobacter sp.]